MHFVGIRTFLQPKSNSEFKKSVRFVESDLVRVGTSLLIIAKQSSGERENKYLLIIITPVLR